MEDSRDSHIDGEQATVRLTVRGKYKEEQRFGDRAVFLLLVLGLFGSLIIGVRRLVVGPPSWDAAVSLAAAAAIAGATIVLSRQRIKVKINRKGISYKVGPFHKRKQKLRWADVASCDIVKTPPAGDWLGTNMHLSDETVASLVGRNGLAIVMNDGRRYFVGVKNLEQLRDLFDAPPVGE